jgi:hypothetical protein
MKAHLARRFLGLFLSAAACPLAWAANAAAEKKPEPAKPYVLFMGADLAVQRDKKFHRVEDVVGSELKIKIGRKEFFVPTRNRNTGLKVSHSLKLTGATAQLDGLEAGPSYTPANDPRHKFNRESGAAGGAAAVQDLAYGQMIAMNLNASQSALNAEGATGTTGAMAQANVAASQNAANAAMQAAAEAGAMMQYSSQYNTGAYADQMQRELAEGNYDAMEVSFKISSPVELDDPHMVILFKFQERDAKPGTEGMLIHAESLDPIGPRPKYMRIRKAGLPRGFKYLDCEVHIFNRGEEVATNASTKRVELTREEAQQYLLIEHLGANKDATVPAAPVPGTLASTRLKELSLDQLNRTYYAKIGPDGSVLGLYTDESCNLKIDNDATLAVVSEVFFKPALVKGKPVEGVARVRLGEI